MVFFGTNLPDQRRDRIRSLLAEEVVVWVVVVWVVVVWVVVV